MESVIGALEGAEYFKTCLVNGGSFVPEEKWTWRPSDSANSAFRLFNHASMSLRRMTSLLNGEEIDFSKAGEMKEPEEERTYEQMKTEFEESWNAFSSRARELSEEELQKEIEVPWGKRTFAKLISDTSMEMTYHFAQLQYLQTIWGDMENHFA